MDLVYLFKSGMQQMASDIARVDKHVGAEAQQVIASLEDESDPMELRGVCETLATWIVIMNTAVVYQPCQK